MNTVAFIGLGTMGGPMASTLGKANYEVLGFDVDDEAGARFVREGGTLVASAKDAITRAHAVITMLPEGEHVRAVYHDHVLPSARPDAVLVDCSTIDVGTARTLAAAASERDSEMLDAPVSGGAEGAAAGTLSFMVGGTDNAYALARPLFEAMGQRSVHFGVPGTGQAAKACHNMICGITSLAVCEAFALATRLDLDAQRFFELCAGAAAQSWILENRCPVPGLAPTSPASNDYRPGFAARLMAKDLRLAQDAAQTCGLETPFGAEAARRFTAFADAGNGELDFSAIYRAIGDG